MRKWFLASLLVLVISALTACGGNEKNNSKDEASEGLLSDGKLTVGVTAGPHEQILEKVKEVGAKEGLDIEIKVFTDYVIPNEALDNKDIDLNVFQHGPYLDQFKEDRNLDLVNVGATLNFPMGVYSSKIEGLEELEDGAKIGLPNDPTNGGRALVLFEEAGLIKLKDGVGVNPTLRDIEENERNFDFIELEAAQIPRQLEELAVAAINSNYAIEHGFVPAEDAVFIEPKDSPWVNIVAARGESKDDEAIAQFLNVYQSDEVKEFIEETFEGSVLTAW